jgi:hypothetical protein
MRSSPRTIERDRMRVDVFRMDADGSLSSRLLRQMITATEALQDVR